VTIQRVPTTQAGRLMNHNIQQAYSRLVTLQDQLSSGKLLQRASDGPAQVMTAMGYRGELRRAGQYERATSDAQGWLNTADSTLQTAVTYLQRVRDLVVQATNGSQDENARAAAATELRSLRDGLLQLANTSYRGRPIFSGTVNAATAPYDASMAYAGNAGVVERNVAPGVTIQVNATGPEVFGVDAGGPSYTGNAFEVISQLADDLEAGNVSEARHGLDAVDATLDRIYGVQASLGARSRRVDDVLARNGEVTLEIQSQLAGVEDIDLPRTIIDVKAQEMAYQAALAATAKVIQPSLLQFLS